jgi:tetratricopeptide (TPR) repeat protein
LPYLERVLSSGTASRDRMAVVLVDRGYAQFALGAVEPARRSFHASIEILPTSRAYQNLAIASLSLGQFGDAETEARAAVQLQPSSAEAHSVLGAVFRSQRRSDEAAAEYREALRLQPSLVSAQEGLRRLER